MQAKDSVHLACAAESKLAHLDNKAHCLVVLIGDDGLLVGTGTIGRHRLLLRRRLRLDGIVLSGAHRLRDTAVEDQDMTAVDRYMPPIARLGLIGVGLADQQSVGITARAVGLVAELDAAEVAIRSLLQPFRLPETLTRP